MIEFDKVGKTYPNGFNALKDVNLKIEQGEFVAIIGLSGAGKSTLMSVLFGLYQPEKGIIKVRGREVKIKGLWTPMPLESVWCTSISSWYTILPCSRTLYWGWRRSAAAS